MKTEQIVYLDDIAKTHSITQTAQRFFISQQALSFSLNKLEEEFGVPLLERTNRGAELTAEGALFLQKALPILDVCKDLKENFSVSTTPAKEQPVPEGALQIFCHSRILEPLLVDLLEQYTRKYPRVQITLYEKENIEIIDAVSQGQGDLGLIFTPEFLLNESSKQQPNSYQLAKNITIEQLFSDQFIVCCNINSPLRNQKSLTMDSFYDTPNVRFDNNPYILAANQEHLPTTQSHQYFSNNTAFHKMMLRRNLAVSVITAFEFRKLYFKHKDLTALPIADSPKSVINLITNTERTTTPAAHLFIHMLKKYDFYGL